MNWLKTTLASITGEKESQNTSNSESRYTTFPSTNTNIAKSPISHAQTIQNFYLVSLDSSIDAVNNVDYIRTITKLGQVVDAVKNFTDVDECIDFVTDVEDEKILLIISGTFGRILIPIVHDMIQINSIYIFCEHKQRYEPWAKKWPKVKGVYTDSISICEALKKNAQNGDQSSSSMSFAKLLNGTSNRNLDQLDQSFMYTQLLKEILLTIDFKQDHIDEFLRYCRKRCVGNSTALNNIEKLRNEYRHYKPIWWYTSQGFLYSMLNRALRRMEIDRIIRMGFFVRDLHENIAALHSEQYNGHHHLDSFIVYRGQGLFQTDFDQMMETKGGLMSFNNFLSTSLDRAVSLAFAESNLDNSDLISVLFEITINPLKSSTSFARISDISAYQDEKEVLFSMHSIFRIGEIKQINKNNQLWQVDLTLTSDNDPQLYALTESIRKETEGATGWLRLGKLMIKLGQYNKAKNLHEMLLAHTTDEREKGDIYYQLGWIKNAQGKYAEAITLYKNSLKIRQKIFTSQHYNVAECYNNIGMVYYNMEKYLKAHSYYRKSLEIRQANLSPNHPHLAFSYNNIGGVYYKTGEYLEALLYYEKAHKILQKTLPPNHPDLATSCNNIGLVYNKMNEYSKALLYHKNALQIYEKTLPSYHPDLATSYSNIGLMYDKMGENSEAHLYHEKSLKIRQKTLPPNHPYLVNSYNSIQGVYDNMDAY